MRELGEWWAEFDGSRKHWLVLGKGPSFETRNEYDLTPYTTLAINHVVREMKVDVASAVNFDVVADCGEAFYENCRFLLMPRYPHTVQGDAPALLETYFDQMPVLRKLSDEGRLVWYNVSSDTIVPGSPVIQNAGFSVGILFNLLGEMGARHLRTLGVDGGLQYAGSFADMTGQTRLANGMKSYDFQFGDIMRAVRQYDLDYTPLTRLTLAERLKMYFRTPASRKYVRRWLLRLPFRQNRGELSKGKK